MKRFQFMLALVMALTLIAPAALLACPNCSEAIANSSQLEAEKDNTPSAFNQSIYLMVGMPYLSFCVVGFLIYRGVKKNEEYRAKERGQPATEPNGSPN